MDRALLERYLEEGLSLAGIGRRVDRHESTVAYWVEKYGLRAANRTKHSAKGGIDRDRLAEMVESGLSVGEIAAEVGLSKTTVRHWLREHGLKTQRASRRTASSDGQLWIELHCSKHGLTMFRLRTKGGYRCTRCRAEAVVQRRRRIKRLLVDEAGGSCRLCGYSRCVAALEFHHVDPAEKSFALSYRGVARSLAKARAEASKCVLLCANCHAEVEAGLVALA
jgi:transposase-like protein